MASSTIEVEMKLSSTVTVAPGHTLIVGTSAPCAIEEAAQIKEHIEKRLPGVSVIVISGVSALASYDPEGRQ